MSQAGERDAFEKAGGHGEHGCTEVVGKASKWTLEVIAEEVTNNSKGSRNDG